MSDAGRAGPVRNQAVLEQGHPGAKRRPYEGKAREEVETGRATISDSASSEWLTLDPWLACPGRSRITADQPS